MGLSSESALDQNRVQSGDSQVNVCFTEWLITNECYYKYKKFGNKIVNTIRELQKISIGSSQLN